MKTKKGRLHALALALFVGSVATVSMVACDDSSSAVKEPTPSPGTPVDSGTSVIPGVDAGTSDAAPKDCFDNPKTHFEIINACTNATRITKNPTLKKLLPDGGLPPLE
jgi:hypothetical protein